jgi:hypothetical protein
MLAHARGSVVWDNMVRTLLLISLTGVAAYAVLIAYVCLFQSRLIYFPNIPGRALTATPAEIGLDFEEVRITTADRIFAMRRTRLTILCMTRGRPGPRRWL